MESLISLRRMHWDHEPYLQIRHTILPLPRRGGEARGEEEFLGLWSVVRPLCFRFVESGNVREVVKSRPLVAR